MRNQRLRRALGGAVALVAAATVALTGAPAASAAPTIPDTGATGSLTIHKHQQGTTPSTTEGNGLPTAIDTSVNPALAGVTFEVTPIVGFDLTTNAGWQAISQLTLAEAADAATGAPRSVTTGADGVALFSPLPVGAYYVQETGYPAGVTPSAPFVMTIPLTHPTLLDTWLYDVHVYPKNAVTTGTKTVEDIDSVALGDAVSYTITSDIPDLAAGETIDGYRVRDVLDGKLTYVGASVALSNGTPLDPADYTITHDTATNTVLVTFTASGLAVLQANSQASVVTTIDTTVNAVGEIVNEATIFPNQPSWDDQTGTTTPPVVTKWGTVTLQKVSAVDPAVVLAGAEFQVYLSEADARAGSNPITTGTPATSTWVTGPDGRVTISGLRYSDWANGAQVAAGDPGYQTYWLVETKSPAGYELLADPIEFEVLSDDTAVDVTVENSPHNGGFQLPLTGGTGLWLFPVGGLLLLGGAAFLLLGRRRRAGRI